MLGSDRGESSIPRWDLSPIYPSLSSPEYRAAKALLAELSAEFIALLGGVSVSRDLGSWLAEALRLEDETQGLYETLSSYAYVAYSLSLIHI